MSQSKAKQRHSIFLRTVGKDPPATAVLASHTHADVPQKDDYAQVDPSLTVAAEPKPLETEPAPGLGYAGFTPAQRAAYLHWLDQPTAPAPEAFRRLLLANAEVGLIQADLHPKVLGALEQLAQAEAWHRHVGLARTILLGCFLCQDAVHLSKWLDSTALPDGLWGLALGWLGYIGQRDERSGPLTAAQAQQAGAAWGIAVGDLPTSALALRLDTLRQTIDAEPLAHALAALGPEAQASKPWRCQHRDLRLDLPQPDVRLTLQPLLAELWSVGGESQAEVAEEEAALAGVEAAEASANAQANTAVDLARAHVILEFGHSNSALINYVLQQARKQPGFQQLMDENRHIVYRVPFRRGDMGRFWRLYDSVQNWSSTRVYADGRQLERWQIYPYSQYMR